MVKPVNKLIQFLARYSVYTVLPGFWFAYVAGIDIWVGGAFGLVVSLLLAIPMLISSQRKPTGERDLLEEILEGK